MVAMAAFLSRRDKVDEAFALLEKSRKSRPVSELMPCALYALRRQPEKATDARRKMLEDWIASALEDEANTQAIKLMQAELYSFEGRTAEAIKIYRDELANPKNSAVQKAVVQNNLAYILATAAERPEIAAEAVKLANDAMRVMGPTPELLDTRGLSYMAQGKLDQALSDLQVAAPDSPTGSKYFHLAQAEMRAKHLDAARNAIAKATEIGLDDGQTSPSDRKLYAKLVDELKQ
jgi:tetratricopeptide (TPR) repeat protein